MFGTMSLLTTALLIGTLFVGPATASNHIGVVDQMDDVEALSHQIQLAGCPDEIEFHSSSSNSKLVVSGRAVHHADIDKCVFHGDVDVTLENPTSSIGAADLSWSIEQWNPPQDNPGASIVEDNGGLGYATAWTVGVDTTDVYEIDFDPNFKKTTTGTWYQTDACIGSYGSGISVHFCPHHEIEIR